MKIIGITGTLGAGKGAIVEYLVRTRGFAHYSMRDFLIEELDRRGMSHLRDNMLIVANDYRKKFGPGYLVEQFLEKAKASERDVVIESIRSVGEARTLKSAPNSILLGVDADIKTRYVRILRRKKSTDNVTFEKFVEDEHKESSSDEPWIGNLPKCLALADYIIHNNGSMDDLHRDIETFLSEKSFL